MLFLLIYSVQYLYIMITLEKTFSASAYPHWREVALLYN